jgi:hypothetical protein
MKPLLLILAICVGIIGTGKRAEAQNYPWCAIYGRPAAAQIADL